MKVEVSHYTSTDLAFFPALLKLPSPLQRLRSHLTKHAQKRTLLITSLTNIAYVTGVHVSAGLLLVDAKKATLFVDGRYREQVCREHVKGIIADDLTNWSTTMQGIKHLAFESEHISVAKLEGLKKKFRHIKFYPTLNVVESLRSQKTSAELRLVLQACSITKSVLLKIPSLLVAGISERDLARRIDTLCFDKGATNMAFSTIVAFGSNTSRPHHSPTERKLKKGDIVQVDMGARVDGYCSDYSRVYFTGLPTEKQTKALSALLKAKKAAEALLKPGVTNRKLDTVARSVLAEHGFTKEFCHALGHGLGLDIHEIPTLSIKAELTRLKKNQVITIEPGLYFEGDFGMRIEDTHIIH